MNSENSSLENIKNALDGIKTEKKKKKFWFEFLAYIVEKKIEKTPIKIWMFYEPEDDSLELSDTNKILNLSKNYLQLINLKVREWDGFRREYKNAFPPNKIMEKYAANVIDYLTKNDKCIMCIHSCIVIHEERENFCSKLSNRIMRKDIKSCDNFDSYDIELTVT